MAIAGEDLAPVLADLHAPRRRVGKTSSTPALVRVRDSEFSPERRATSSTEALTSSMEATASSEMAASE